MTKITNIAIIGAGNVAGYLARSLENSFQVKSFARKALKTHFPIHELPSHLDETDLVLLCVSDGAIADVSTQLPASDTLVAHVSGAMPLNKLAPQHTRRAVLYPLMSINADSNMPISEIPFCLEAEKEEDYKLLANFAERLGAKHYNVNSMQRTYLHIAAVLGQNFSNHLYHKAEELLGERGMDFKMLLPLLEHSLARLKEHPAKAVQTGPAKRNDAETMAKHLDLISDADTKSIYKVISESILKTYEQEL